MTDKNTSPRFVSDNLSVDILMSLIFCVSMMSIEVLSMEYFAIGSVTYTNLLATSFLCIVFVFIRRLRIPQVLMIGLHFLAGAIYLTAFYFIVLYGSDIALGGIIFMGICIFILFVHSMRHRWSKGQKQVALDNLLVSMSLHTVLLFCMAVMGFFGQTFYIFLDAIFIVALHFAPRQLDVFERRYYHNLHSSTQPIKNIKSQNHLTIIVVFGGVFFALFMLLFMPVEAISKAFQGIAAAVLGFIGWIITLINNWAFSGADKYVDHGDSLVNPDTQNYEPSDASMIFTVIIIVIISITLFTLIVISFRRLLKRFQNAEGSEKVVENDAVVDIIEDVPKKKRFSRRQLDFGSGEEGKIRRLYYNAVTRAMKKGLVVKASSSPRQIEGQMKETGDLSISELTSRYESVRYNKKDS